MNRPYAYKDSKPKNTINTTPTAIAAKSTSSPSTRSQTPTITPTRSRGSPPNLNKDKPLPPPPADDNRRSAYPKIDSSQQPRAAPPLPPTPRSGPSGKAQKILGAGSPVTPQLAQVSPGTGLSSSGKAGKVLNHGKAGEARGLGLTHVATPPQQITHTQHYKTPSQQITPIPHSKKRSTEEAQPNKFSPQGSWSAATNTTGNARDIFTRAQTNLKGLPGSANVSSSTNATQPAANTQNVSIWPAVNTPPRKSPVRNHSSPEVTISSQNRSRSGSRTTPRDGSPLAWRTVASPSSQYSDPVDLLSDNDDLDQEMAETEAYWAAHALSPQSNEGATPSKAKLPVSPGMHRRSRSYNDLYHQHQTSLSQSMATVPERNNAAAASQQVSRMVSKKKSYSSVTNQDRTELWQGLRDTTKYGSRADAKTASKVIRRLTSTKQFPPIAVALAQAPNAPQSVFDHQRSGSGEKNRASVSWNKTFNMVKNLTREKVSVEEIIPMKGPGSMTALEQAKLTEQMRVSNARAKDRATFIAAAAPTLQATVYEGPKGTPPFPRANIEDQTPAETKTTLSPASNSNDLALIPEEQAEAETIPDRQVAPRSNHVRTVSPPSTTWTVQPDVTALNARADRVDPEKRDTQYYKQKIEEANALFTKFIQNPDQHQTKLQSLIDDTRAERKTLIFAAQPLEAWFQKKKEVEEAAALVAGLTKSPVFQSKEMTIPSHMPRAPAIMAAPHSRETSPSRDDQTTAAKPTKRVVAIPPPLNLQAQQRLTSPVSSTYSQPTSRPSHSRSRSTEAGSRQTVFPTAQEEQWQARSSARSNVQVRRHTRSQSSPVFGSTRTPISAATVWDASAWIPRLEQVVDAPLPSRSGPRSPRTPVRANTQKRQHDAALVARLKAEDSVYSKVCHTAAPRSTVTSIPSRKSPQAPRFVDLQALNSTKKLHRRKSKKFHLFRKIKKSNKIPKQTNPPPVEMPASPDATVLLAELDSPTVPLNLPPMKKSKDKNKKPTRESRASADVPIVFNMDAKPAHDYNRNTTFGEFLDKDFGAEELPAMPSIPLNYQQARVRQALEEQLVSPLDEMLSPQAPAPLKFSKNTSPVSALSSRQNSAAQVGRESSYSAYTATGYTPQTQLTLTPAGPSSVPRTTRKLSTPEESVVGTPSDERGSFSFAFPNTEMPRMSLDYGARKRSSVAVPGIEMPNYHVREWWDQNSDAESEFDGQGQRTVAEIRSWQFNLDDELAQLARLKSWDWEERNESAMLFTLDFNTPQN